MLNNYVIGSINGVWLYWIYNIIIFIATVRKPQIVQRNQLKDFGKYVAECLPKFIQKVQITSGDELELLIAPEGIIPVLQFLKDNHNSQFSNLSDITAIDVPSRQYRFEVFSNKLKMYFLYPLTSSRLSIIFYRYVLIHELE